MNSRFSARRRRMLVGAPAIGAALVARTADASDTVAQPTGGHTVTGPVTFYAELRVMPSLKAGFDAAMPNFAGARTHRVRIGPLLQVAQQTCQPEGSTDREPGLSSRNGGPETMQ